MDIYPTHSTLKPEFLKNQFWGPAVHLPDIRSSRSMKIQKIKRINTLVIKNSKKLSTINTVTNVEDYAVMLYSKCDKDPKVVKEKIYEAYKLMENYMAMNKLVINSDKTHLLIMASAKNHRRKGDYGITLNTGSEIIEPQINEKLLGGFISNDLTWKEHLRDNKKSLFKILTSRINALSKISRISSFKTRKIIANGIFLSKLIYLIQL